MITFGTFIAGISYGAVLYITGVHVADDPLKWFLLFSLMWAGGYANFNM